jgi:DNA repair protein RecO (recombination protein O)
MNMNLNTDGLVIKESTTGEKDRVVTLLTRDLGVIRAFVRGAKIAKSRSVSATQLLGYSKLSIYRGRDAYIVDDARPEEIFFGLRGNIERLSLAQYFCELAGEIAPRESEAGEYLSLILNAIHLLEAAKRPQPLIKAVTELRLMCLSGYMPDIAACSECGGSGDGYMYFNKETGRLFCASCVTGNHGTPTGIGVVSAMRHICRSEPKKIFNFNLSEKGLEELAAVTEEYLLTHLQRKFKTLDFYSQLIK